MDAFVIVHNIIVEYEHDDNRVPDLDWDFMGPLLEPDHASCSCEDFPEIHRQICNLDVHQQLQDNLVGY